MKVTRVVLMILIGSSFFLYCFPQKSFFGPGYRWDLFRETANWDLANAVAEQDTSRIFKIIKDNNVNVNLQEPKFGRTLLILAVGNDRPLSTEALLRAGADVNIRDAWDEQAIHEATKFIRLKKHAYGILKTLIGYHANVNSISQRGTQSVPMEGAIEDLSCAKLLFEQGANIYYKTSDSNYVVWSRLCSNYGDNLFVAKYLIVDRNMPIPSPVLITIPNHYPRNFRNLLDLLIKSNDPRKEEAKDFLKTYLKKINYPKGKIYQTQFN